MDSHNSDASNVELPIELKDYDPIADFKLFETQGILPPKCYGMGYCVVGNKLYCFGGTDVQGQFVPNDLYCLTSDTYNWSVVDIQGSKPRSRNFHSMVYYDYHLYMFGGKCPSYLNELYSFNITNKEWQLLESKGNVPTKRYGHTSTIANDKMYMIGGYDSYGEQCNDIMEYDFETFTWKKIQPSLGTLPPRYHHTTVYWDGSLYVLGGYKLGNMDLYEFRLSTRVWAKVNTKGKLPNPRWGHRSVVHEDTMYVLGGSDSAIAYGDLYKYHFKTFTWERQITENLPPRYFHSLSVLHNKLIVFGGMNTHNFFFNELHYLSIDKFQDTRSDTMIPDFKKLLQTGNYSDVTFEFPDDTRSIKAHRCIVSARSQQLSAMLSSGMRESQAGFVIIRGTPYEIFYMLVEYLYTSTIPEDAPFDQLIELLKLADQYLLDHLKSLCEKEIFPYVSVHNVASLYDLAEELRGYELKEFCFKFLLKNYEALVIKRIGEPIINDDLMKELKKYLKL